jgi:hypothetical protein
VYPGVGAHATCSGLSKELGWFDDAPLPGVEADMLDPKLMALLAIGTLLVVSGIFDIGWRGPGGRDESL